MEIEQVLSYFSAEGVWAVLSAILIFHIANDRRKRDERQALREENYRAVIAELTASLKDVAEIKEMLKEKLDK